MFNVTRRVSFAVVIALTVGWGAFFLLFLASSNTLLEAQQRAINEVTVLPPGVKLKIQVDKDVYRGGDTILAAVRNDSRLPVYVQAPDGDCAPDWWFVERLESDGETWATFDPPPTVCSSIGLDRFTNHTLRPVEWTAVLRTTGPKGEPIKVPTGTYRITIPYLKGKDVQDAVWPAKTSQVSSMPFTVL